MYDQNILLAGHDWTSLQTHLMSGVQYFGVFFERVKGQETKTKLKLKVERKKSKVVRINLLSCMDFSLKKVRKCSEVFTMSVTLC